MPIDALTLTQVLTTCLADVVDSGGWGQPDHMFALRGAVDAPQLQYVMQIPGPAVDFLPSLIELGMRTGIGVHGLAVASTDFEPMGYGEAQRLPLMTRMRGVCVDAGLSASTVSAHQKATWQVLGPAANERGVCSVMGVLPDRTTRVVTAHEGGGLTVQDDLPEVHGDHERVVALLLRLMRRPMPLPAPRIVASAV